MKKRFFSILLAISMLCAFVPITSSAENGTQYGNYLYYGLYNNNTEIIITDCDTSVTEIVIPSEINGLPVTIIGDSAFEYCTSLTSITIPDSVTNIGSYAFDGCVSLTSITIPYGVTDIGSCAFRGCSNMTNITVDENNTDYSSSDGVLYNKDKTELIQYPCGNERTEFTIPDTVTSIAVNAFNSCVNLINVTISDSVANIGLSPFNDCSGLTNITVDENNADYSSLQGVLYNKDKTVLIRYPIGNERTEFTIPDTVTEIDGFAFKNGDKLTSITIPKDVTKIGGSAFDGCSKLTNVTIPSGVTQIEDYVFYGCSSLMSIIIPDNVTRIGTCAFFDCGSLTGIVIPDDVSYIASYAFAGCNSLANITVGENNHSYVSVDGVLYDRYQTDLIQYPVGNTRTEFVIPDGVTKIDEYAFSNCSSLTSITIPVGVSYIARYAFSDCNNLKDVYFKGTKSEWNNIYIGLYNGALKNVTMHFNKKTTAEITKSETDTAYTFEVNAEDKYEDCYVYAAIYDENGKLVGIGMVPMNTEDNTTVSVDKKDNGKTAKIFLWTDTIQPVIENVKVFEI